MPDNIEGADNVSHLAARNYYIGLLLRYAIITTYASLM